MKTSKFIVAEAFFYGIFGGMATLVVLAVVLLGAAILWAAAGDFVALSFMRRGVLLVGIVFLCGAVGNAVFTTLLRGRAYVAADPLVDWIPWFPSGDWTLDLACGGHYLGSWSLWRLRLAWTAVAGPTWITALVLWRWATLAVRW